MPPQRSCPCGMAPIIVGYRDDGVAQPRQRYAAICHLAISPSYPLRGKRLHRPPHRAMSSNSGRR